MSSYDDLLREGRLPEAITAAVDAVRVAPSNVTHRIALFELLAAAGDYERARKHLDVVVDKRPEMLEAVASYSGVLAAEKKRADLFERGEGEPQQVTPIPTPVSTRPSVLRLMIAGDHAAARTALDEIDEPPIKATVDGTPCDDLRDADDFFGPTLEVIAQGRYGWIPLSSVTRIVVDPPKHFRDLIWMPATVHLDGGLNAAVLLPCRYPGSERHDDDRIRLGRTTDWVEREGIVRGLGQRALLVGDDLRALTSIRDVTIHRDGSTLEPDETDPASSPR